MSASIVPLEVLAYFVQQQGIFYCRKLTVSTLCQGFIFLHFCNIFLERTVLTQVDILWRDNMLWQTQFEKHISWIDSSSSTSSLLKDFFVCYTQFQNQQEIVEFEVEDDCNEEEDLDQSILYFYKLAKHIL